MTMDGISSGGTILSRGPRYCMSAALCPYTLRSTTTAHTISFPTRHKEFNYSTMSESLDAVPKYFITPSMQQSDRMSVHFHPRDAPQEEDVTLVFNNREEAWKGVTTGETEYPFTREAWDEAISKQQSLLTFTPPWVSKSWAHAGRAFVCVRVCWLIHRGLHRDTSLLPSPS